MRSIRLGTAVTILALSLLPAMAACGDSIEDTRADAYKTIEALPNLDSYDKSDYKQRLDTAPDKAAVDNILSEAEQESQDKGVEASRQAEASASASASAAAAEATASAQASASASASAAHEAKKAELEKALSGNTFTVSKADNAECLSLTVTFNADHTYSGTAAQDIASAKCLPNYTSAARWYVRDGQAGGESLGIATSSDGSSGLYVSPEVVLNPDGTITVQDYTRKSMTLTKQ